MDCSVRKPDASQNHKLISHHNRGIIPLAAALPNTGHAMRSNDGEKYKLKLRLFVVSGYFSYLIKLHSF